MKLLRIFHINMLGLLVSIRSAPNDNSGRRQDIPTWPENDTARGAATINPDLEGSKMQDIVELLLKHKSTFSNKPGLTKVSNPSIQVLLYLLFQTYSYSSPRKEILQKEVMILLEQDLIEVSIHSVCHQEGWITLPLL